MLLLVLIDSLQVLSIMAPKQDRVYARGQSKSVAPSFRLVIGSDDERDPDYVTPGTALQHEMHVQPELRPKRWRPA